MKFTRRIILFLILLSTIAANSTFAQGNEGAAMGNADVLFVRAIETGTNEWTFHVTVSHPDKGWQDYADGWDVVTENGSVLKTDPSSPFTRLLLHPHEAEQPFTRSQSGIMVPEGTSRIIVRAHDLADGFGGKTVTVYLTAAEGTGFEVQLGR